MVVADTLWLVPDGSVRLVESLPLVVVVVAVVFESVTVVLVVVLELVLFPDVAGVVKEGVGAAELFPAP